MPGMNAKRWPGACRAWLWLGLTVALALQAGAVLAAGPVFEASRPGSAPVFLVGTMHSDDPRVMAMLPRVVELIGEVDTVALEMVHDPAGMARAAMATLLPGGPDLFERAGPSRREALERAAARRSIPAAALGRLKPWAAALVLGLPQLSGEQFLDTAIQQQAQRLGRRVVGLETAAEQLAVFDAMDEPLQLALLDAAVKNADDLTQQLEELTAIYLAGDLDRLQQVAQGHYGGIDPAVEHWFRAELIERRNRRMAERMRELAEHGPLLVAVGALHLPGDSGLVAELERQGFRVEARSE